MKRIFTVIAAAAALFTLVSCEPSVQKTVSLTVSVDESELTDLAVSLPESYVVKVVNESTMTSTELETENGVANFTGLIPGMYTVSASASVADGGSSYIFSGSSRSISVLENTELPLTIACTKSSSLIFKEIYYCGASATGDDFYFRDQFYEIYNSGDATVYADGLCIAETFFANYNFTLFYEWDITNPSNYVFAQRIWQIKGKGTDYPIAPGESIVIAQWATDHTVESLSKGASKVNLSGAEFEAVMGEVTFNGVVLTDNAAINMELVVNSAGYNMPQWLTSTSGSTYIIFNPSKELKNESFVSATNSTSTVNAREILISDVLDAVQAGADETRAQTLGLPTVLDAGFQYLGESYLGKSIARKKTGVTEDGRPIFQDTNNTTDDFEIFDTPQIRRYSVGVPSWNTWIK